MKAYSKGAQPLQTACMEIEHMSDEQLASAAFVQWTKAKHGDPAAAARAAGLDRALKERLGSTPSSLGPLEVQAASRKWWQVFGG